MVLLIICKQAEAVFEFVKDQQIEITLTDQNKTKISKVRGAIEKMAKIVGKVHNFLDPPPPPG